MNEAIAPQQIEILFEIASQPGLTQQELANRTGMALSSISRNLMALGEWNRSGKPGLSLVETADDPNERRRQIAFLSPKGGALCAVFLSN
ncbi:winged helix-turn-helix transcriptional regulator [Microvirga sp. BT689]|uniref:MarR family winged helix-turn-helix transcriptional regulator n=1 Tax=Microvirga arvi TaxID=2778731 RepID=UPI001951703B|nr:MarR family winged helix-turn-helix transcriptional regulator [Microvirga arvi]MBM6582903.1 winged helix-turn-helix transcriptional regulator [Microvirga arvi]